MGPKNTSSRCSENNKGIPNLLLKVPARVGCCHKRLRMSPSPLPSGDRSSTDLLDQLPEDLLIYILSKLSSSARSPSDLFNALISSKRLYSLRLNDSVLSKASMECLSVRPGKWSVSAHKFLRRCALAGNLEACFILGMIRFYCLANRTSGMSLLARAALGSHASAMYSIAVIQFNGSGGTKSDKDLRAGVALCARAASLGHLDAIRELGHCLQDGYGVRRNIDAGRRCLIYANYNELVGVGRGPTDLHPAYRFMVGWYADRRMVLNLNFDDLRLCSGGCGRTETRRHEFRRCSVCGAVNYCSRACQARHWKEAHKGECMAVEDWLLGGELVRPTVGGGDVPADGGA